MKIANSVIALILFIVSLFFVGTFIYKEIEPSNLDIMIFIMLVTGILANLIVDLK